MKKFYVLFCLFSIQIHAQTQIEVSTRSEIYTDLENSISLTNGEVWDDPDLVIPLGFDFVLSSNTFNTLYISEDFSLGSEVTLSPSNFNNSPIFAPTILDYIDRGYDSEISESEISYVTTSGQDGKILKIQWKNVGFFGDETGEDFMNVQMWLYENTNKIEYRYGPVQINNFQEVYDGLEGAPVAVATSINLLNGEILDNAYFLTGNPTEPTLIKLIPGQFPDELIVLDGTIPENTVYEFRNTTLSNSNFNELIFRSYPNPVKDVLYIESNESNFDAEIYNLFGQRVLSVSNSRQIDVSNLNTGTYLLKIQTDGNSVTKKMIKN